MIKTKEDLSFYLSEDAKRNGIENSRLKYYIRLLCGSEQAHIYHWIRHYRKWEYYANTNQKLFALYHMIRTKQIGFKLGIAAHINTIGYGLRIMHIAGGGGCGIWVKKAGNYCGFNSGVLIGVSDNKHNCPVLGDRVAFGPGSKAFGNITIASNTFIAPNAVVANDCKGNSIYGGVPAKFIKLKT